jgi:hypothetical protein
MPPKKKTNQPATNPQQPEPHIYTGDIFVGKTLVSSVSLKAATQAAANLAINKMIKVKVK